MNPFIAIYQFIKTKLFEKYPVLTECYMFDDEEDSRYKEYYLKYKDNLTTDKIMTLRDNIIDDIYEFCNKNGYEYEFSHCAILITRLV